MSGQRFLKKMFEQEIPAVITLLRYRDRPQDKSRGGAAKSLNTA